MEALLVAFYSEKAALISFFKTQMRGLKKGVFLSDIAISIDYRYSFTQYDFINSPIKRLFMKWAQTKKVLDDDGVKNANERKLFKEYKTEKELKNDLADGTKFVIWATYPDDDPLQKSFALKRKSQRKYEIFCGGFLFYHDVEFKKYPKGEGINADKDNNILEWKKYPDKFTGPDGIERPGTEFGHNVYFEWFPKQKGKGNQEKTKVIIHISPTPGLFNANPPKPPPPPPPES